MDQVQTERLIKDKVKLAILDTNISAVFYVLIVISEETNTTPPETTPKRDQREMFNKR